MRMRFFTTALMLLAVGCATRTPDTEVDLLRLAARAIRQNDWQGYSELTVTTSDFIRLNSKMTPMAFKQSYAGSVVKPQEEKRHRDDFVRAAGLSVSGMALENASYQGPGSLNESGMMDLLDGKAVPFTLRSVKLKAGGREVDTRDLPLIFKVVKWGEQYRIIGLVLPPGTEDSVY